MPDEITIIEKIKIRTSSNEEIMSILNLGYNGHPNFWFYAKEEANRRKIYFIQNIIQLDDNSKLRHPSIPKRTA